MFTTEADHEESVGFIHPAGDQRQMGEACRTDTHRRRVKDMTLIILAQAQFQFRPQVVQPIRVQPGEAQDLRFRMGMCLTTAVPLAATAVKPPGEVDFEPLQVLAPNVGYFRSK